MRTRLVGRLAELGRLRTVLDDDGPTSVAVIGESGVGKSRLLVEIAAEAAQKGWHVRWLYGSAPLRTVPFAALVHAVEDTFESIDPLATMTVARRALVGPGGRRTLVLVDDAHHMDEGSLGLIDQVVRHGDARVVMGTRGPALWSDGLTALVDRALAVTLDVFDRETTDALAAELIGSRVSERLVQDVWNRSRGLPLFVVVLLDAVVAEQGLVSTDAGVDAPGGLPFEPLRDLVERRIARAGEGVHRVVELLAIGGPTPRSALETLVSEGALDRALRAGLVIDRADQIEAVHPIYPETLRPDDSDRRTRLAAQLLAALPAPVTAHDRLRSAVLAAEAGLPLDGDQWGQAAMDALERLDPHLAIDLARKAVDADSGVFSGQIALGKALAFVGEVEEAIAVLQGIEARNEGERTTRATALAHALAFGAGRSSEAIEMLRIEADTVGESARLILDNERALYAAVSGSFHQVLAAGERVLESDIAPPRARLDAGINVALARAMLADVDQLDLLLEENDRLARTLSFERPLARLQNELIRVATEHARGRLQEARRITERNLEERFDPAWLQWRGILHGQVGSMVDAVGAARAAVEAFEKTDPFRLRAQALGAMGLHLGQMGAISAVDAALVEDADEAAGGEMRIAAWTGRGRAWVDCVTSGPIVGAARAMHLGGWLMDRDHVCWGSLALHDALRMGVPAAEVVEAIEGFRGSTSGAGLVETIWTHAVALESGDLAALRAVGVAFRRFGALGLARETWAQLSSRARQAGNSIVANRAATHSQLLAVHTPDLRTPILAVDIVGLTRRELDVVGRVLQNNSNRQIADALYLSVRTVENHLHSIYRKLGLSGRDELVAELTD